MKTTSLRPFPEMSKLKRSQALSGLIVFAMAMTVAFNPSPVRGADEKSPAAPKRILFIGNSYTAGIRNALKQAVIDSSFKEVEMEFITPGGATLKRHLGNEQTRQKIQTGDWDVVVLQDQSQTPALPGKFAESFHDSVDEFTGLIRGAGAEPLLFMTWGRRDGDKRNQEQFPDFDTMQKKLTSAYRAAAERNHTGLAPVGEVWSAVRHQDEALGKALYSKDGSHPSAKGAYLGACVFFRVLFDDTLESMPDTSKLEAEEAQLIKAAALKTTEEP